MTKKNFFFLVTVIFLMTISLLHAQNYFMYVGTYTLTKNGGEGIYLYRFSASDGSISYQTVTKDVQNPSFLITDKNKTHLYAVSEMEGNGEKKGGAVASFSINKKTGILTFLNQSPTDGSGPCHLALDHSGKLLFTANYGGGSITVFPVLPDGTVGKHSALIQHTGHGINPSRQKGPHTHEVVMDPVKNLLYSPDLGLDKIFIYSLNIPADKLSPWEPPFLEVTPGSGPRHLVFSPNNKYLYVLQEMGSEITAFTFSPDRKKWTRIQQISLLPPGTDKTGNTGAELQVTRDGKFLYASNRGHNSIALFKIMNNGRLVRAGDYPCGGETPRFFTLDPTEKFLLVLNQDSGNMVTFKRNSKGDLEKTGVDIKVPKPVCAIFVPVK